MAREADRKGQLLVDELKQVVGEEAVAQADLDMDRALRRRPSRITPSLASSRLLLIVAGAVLVVVGVIASLAFETWLFFAVAIAVHALFAVVVVATALTMVTEGEKPAPTTEAQLEEEGVSDPSGALDDLVEQVESQGGAGDQPDGRGRGAS
jgi:hypothetical protein